MAYLFSPKARAYHDESLESYLLRVVAENNFTSYHQLSFAIREELHELDFEAHGAFPIELKRLNIYHAKHNSCVFRDDPASDFGMSRPPISVSSGH